MDPITEAILRALTRMEKKQDEMLKMLQALSRQPMLEGLNFSGQVCPLCKGPIKYTRVSPGATMRTCNCQVDPMRVGMDVGTP